MSFFDEDDEPRTRVRPRRPASSRAASPDRQTVLIRQVVLFGGIILVVIIMFLLVRGCRNTAAENAMKDYNRAVGSLVSDSDTQVGKPTCSASDSASAIRTCFLAFSRTAMTSPVLTW